MIQDKEAGGLKEGKRMYYAGETVEKLKRNNQIVIFGAGLVAREVASCLGDRPYELQVDCFLVSDQKGNPEKLLGLPVVSLEEAEGRINKDGLIVVAVMGKYLMEVCKNLHAYGYFHLLPMTFESDLWSLIQGNYYREWRLSQGKKYLTLEEELEKVHKAEDKDASVHIYTARCHVDRQLKEDLSRYSWEIPIQAGAALTKERICEIRDDQGENISHKNRQYCELTALYWIWKNDVSAYAGLGHYRRHFELDEELLKRLPSSDIDVVLTLPILNFPSVGEVYRHDHVGRDWEVMLEAVRSLAPDYASAAEELEQGNFYYGYNMFIARKKILDDYCAWLFPLLEYCEEHCGEREGTYQRRYIGFLAERLMGIYFLKHEAEYKIVHARKHFVGR